MPARVVRRLRYCVAASLDGFIAGPHGEIDWINSDPSIDFAALWSEFDTLVMGRRTFEVAIGRFPTLHKMGKQVVVVSTTLKPKQYPGVRIVGEDVADAVEALKTQSGKDIWLMGGGMLFRSLADTGIVDTVEVAVSPVLLGSGVPLIPEGRQVRLHLETSYPLPSGIVRLTYSVLSTY